MSVKITYFVHGTTTDNENHRSTGQLHGELSSRGIQQSKELKNQISLDDFDGVFCSDLQRAVDSAKYTFGGVKPIIQDKRLRECDYGDLNGADETLVVYEQHIYKSFPNGESMQEVEKRMRAFCAFLLKNYNGKHIAIVAHKAPQFAFQVITEKKSWEQVIDEDWRKRKAWQPGWEYVIEPFYNEPSPPKGNYAFIDGQNLHLGTTNETPQWKIDFLKFRRYLSEKYGVIKAYYFLGYIMDNNKELYTKLQEAGFIVMFKQQTSQMITHKKGNVDSDMIFCMMKSLIEEEFDKIILVSGDGDYKIVVDYLIKKQKFLKVLLPNTKFASSLYKRLETTYYDYLQHIKHKLIQ